MKKRHLLLLVFFVLAILPILRANPSGLYQHLPEFPGEPGSTIGQAVPLDSRSLMFLLAGVVVSIRAFLPAGRGRKKNG